MKLPSRHTRSDQRPEGGEGIGVPPLSRFEQFGAAATVLGGAAVGGLGFYASFGSVSIKAAEWGFSDPWVLPTAIDSAIPVFTVAYLLLIRTGMPLWWARLVPWVLSLVTCALNVEAGTSLWSKVAHGAMSLLWVVVSEIAAHTYAVRIGAATGRRRQMDKVRWARWILSPLPTFRLWRRMKLWELTSYDTVLQLEQERIVYEAQLRGRFGVGWRWKAPVAARLPLQLVNAGIPLSETASAGLRAAGLDPEGFLTLTPPAAQVNAPPVPPALPPAQGAKPAAVNKPRPVTVAVPPPPGPGAVPAWSTEDELYQVLKDVLDSGRRDVFEPGGPLTGGEVARVLGQSEGNGRKVRLRLCKTYAAERSVALPPKPTMDQILEAFANARTAVGP
ncbi:DUF2637 domain-containing protein [Streptomyces sp. NPDC056362]|uniref:DUF2637 domain-containing protein n=1 Tax=unclassified Streptomyces TaxID=2593676 RepID=UPI0035DB57D4